MPTVSSHAKINWMLRVLWRREDGFHELETIFQEISLHDVIHVHRSTAFSLTCDDPSIPTDSSNLVARAWAKLQHRFGIDPVSIHLEKRIPAGGGLGGGSSNAAATLLALRSMFNIEVSDGELAVIALGLGSDVPFFLNGRAAYARGRGEVLTTLDAPEVPLLLCLPAERVMTPEAFRLLAARREGARFEPSLSPVAAAEVMRDPVVHASRLVNDLESVVFDRLPELGNLKSALAATGAAWAAMSGSGSTVAGAFRDEAARDGAAELLAGTVKVVKAETRAGMRA